MILLEHWRKNFGESKSNVSNSVNSSSFVHATSDTRSTITGCLSQHYHKTRIKTRKLYLVSTSTQAAHPSRRHIDRSTISAMRKRVNILFVLLCALHNLWLEVKSSMEFEFVQPSNAYTQVIVKRLSLYFIDTSIHMHY